MTSARTETPQDAAHRLASGRKVEALHVYRDAAGQVIYHRIRARDHDGGKWIRPMRLNGKDYELGEPAFPNGKPLYKLDQIAANLETSVYVVEGEKAVGALTSLGAVATTSGGAQSASAADWTPLKGREVRLWADNDDAGRAYMGEVAAILQGLDCKLSAVNIDALDLPPKGDAWDWAHAHVNPTLADLEALERVAARVGVPEVSNPSGRFSGSAAGDLPRVELLSAASIPPEAVTWLWPEWIAAGKLHILAGPPGAGKTTLALAIGATLTIRGRWPDRTQASQHSVVIWSGEDAPSDTLVPRLLANGADLSRVHFVGPVRVNTERRPFDPAKDVPLLAEQLSQLSDVGLIVIDPVVSAVSGDAHKSADVRRALQPLADLAQQTGAAIIGISHFSKGTAGRDPVERVTGSVAFGAAARIVLGAAKRSDDQGGGRVLVRAKSNLGPDVGGFVYDLQQVSIPGHPDITASRLIWGEALEGTARALLAEVETDEGEDEKSALANAKAFLETLLAEGPVPSKVVWADAHQAGHAQVTVRRAMKALGVETKKTAMSGGWSWSLPPKMLKNPEDAHAKEMSTFGKDEHLREPETTTERF